jgi:iron complex transport system ATP-binding protein
MSAPAIQIRNLGLMLGNKTILTGFSLDIQSGEYVSIVGPNGAGKTSLVKCIGLIHSGWTGCIKINGRDARHTARRELARQISYVPQAEGRPLPFTVFEFVLMGRYPHLSPFSSIRTDDRRFVEHTMSMAGILPLRNRRLDTLSGGERQMVFIAAALAQEAGILLLDEPTAFLDYRHQVQVAQLLSRLHRENGLTILAVNHDINTAYAQSTRIVALRNGRLFFYETPRNAMDGALLERLYETPFTVTGHPNGRGCIALPEEQP